MTGILGSANLLNGPSQAIYVNNKDAATVATVNICNRNPNQKAQIRLAVSSTQSPGNTEWIEYDTEIEPNGVLERSGIWVNSLQYIVARSNVPNVSIVSWGVSKGSLVTAPSLVVPTVGTITWSTAAALGSTSAGVLFTVNLLATDSNAGTVYYSLASGAFPTNFGLSTTGILGGRPTPAGSYSFTIAASNGTNSTNRTFSLTVT